METFVDLVFGVVTLSSQSSPATVMTRVKRLDKVLADYGGRSCHFFGGLRRGTNRYVFQIVIVDALWTCFTDSPVCKNQVDVNEERLNVKLTSRKVMSRG